MEKSNFKIIVTVVLAVIAAAAIVLVLNKNYNNRIAEKYKNGVSVSQENAEKPSQSNSPSNPSEPTSEPVSEIIKKRDAKDIEILVNFENKVPDNWSVNLVNLRNGQQIDRRAYEDLQKMMDDARAKGYEPFICSSYRTQDYQTRLYNNKVNEYKNQGYSQEQAEKEAGKWVAVPGTSEHQLGFALDIVTVDNQSLDNSQLKSECQQWLMKNCYDYGYILRYPEDKTDITKIDFEPWHYRYVGHEAAQIIKEKGLCLEEYVEQYLNRKNPG